MNIINLSAPAGISSPVAECGAVMIGYVGEGGVTQVVLDFSAWAQAYGDGVITLGVQRSGDPSWYPVALTVDGTTAAWLVSKTDTNVEGMGVARFAYTVGGAEKRSAVWQFFVDRGLQSPEGDAPDPYESWVKRLEDLGAETLQNAQAAQNAAGAAEQSATDAEAAQQAAETAVTHYPKIVNDYWWVWDAERREFVNTGVKAKGEGGEGAVSSVNGQTGAVTLDAEDVGALPDSSTLDDIPDGRTYKRPTGVQLQQIATNAADIQTQSGEIDQLQADVDAIEQKIPNQASSTNQLADKAFVNSSIQTSTAHFRGSWPIWADVPTNPALYPADDDGITTPTTNDYMVLQDASGYTAYGYTLEGTWRFKYTGNWETNGRLGWRPEYQVNETPLTSAQLAALNSGATAETIASIADKLDKTGDGSNVTVAFVPAAARAAIATGEKLSVLLGKIAKWLADLGTAAWKNTTSAVTQGSTDLVESGAVYTAVAAKYTKPSSGIPASDLAAGAIPSAYTSNPAALGTASPGSATSWARGDHVHQKPAPADIGAQPATVVVTVTGTTPTINAEANTRYVCGELATLDLTPPASGICDVVFTSGSTATVLTVPSTVKWANDFDPESLEANKTYELNICDGLGVAASWT